MLKVGDMAPDFSLLSDPGPSVSLTDYRGKTLILYFFPRANTPGCTSEASQFRDAEKDMARLGAEVLGVSADTVEALARFRAKYRLNFKLAGDPTHKILEAYGVWQEKNMYGKKSMGIVRTTYIIRSDGRVAHVFPKVKVDGHAQMVLSALKG